MLERGSTAAALETLERAACLEQSLENRANEARCFKYIMDINVARGEYWQASMSYLRSRARGSDFRRTPWMVFAIVSLTKLLLDQKKMAR